MISRPFWKDRRVLVTGHTGFKGSWLSLWLQSLGARVVGYALPPPTEPSLFELAGAGDTMVSLTGDVRDLDQIKAALIAHKPEIVLHMAAQPLIRYSYDNPVETYATNVMGTVNLLEAVRQTDSVRVMVCITSDKCYQNNEWVWGYREEDRLGGHDPYSSSKGCAELVIAAYRDSYFPVEGLQDQRVALASTRAGNVIGGGDWAKDRLIPDIARALIETRPVIVRNPGSIRPWQFVLEPLSGYLLLAERLWDDGAEFAQSWNFGPNAEEVQPVSWIVDYMAKLWGEGARSEVDPTPHQHEDTYLKLDCSKANSLLDWSPRLRLSTALEWTVEWYRGYQRGEDMRAITEVQISRYESIRQGVVHEPSSL